MRLGVPEFILIVALVFGFLLAIWPARRIFAKAGYPPWLGFLVVFPVLNFVLFLFLAFSEWPVERELNQLRRRQ